MVIDHSKNKSLYNKFIDNKVLTTRDLYEIGFTKSDLKKMVESGRIRRIKRGYYDLDSADGMFWYYKILTSKRYWNSEKAALVLKRCLEIEPENGSVNARLFIDALYKRNWNIVWKSFDILEKTDNVCFKRDQNLWLYLLSFCSRIPDKYKERVSKMSMDDVSNYTDDERYSDFISHYKIRKAIMENDFNTAYELLCDTSELRDKKLYALVLEILLREAIQAEKVRTSNISRMIAEGKYSDIVRLLEKKNALHGLSESEEVIIRIARDLVKVVDEKDLFEVEDISMAAYFKDAILNHDYVRALQLFNRSGSKIVSLENKNIEFLLERVIAESEMLKLKNDFDLSSSRNVGSKVGNDVFKKITNCLLNKDIDGTFELVDCYLEKVGKSQYRGYIADLIKLSYLEKDFAFVDPMHALASLGRGAREFDTTVYIQDFYLSLCNGEFKKAAIFLDIVSLSLEIVGVDVDTTDMKRALIFEAERVGLTSEDLGILVDEKESVSDVSKDIVVPSSAKKEGIVYNLVDVIDRVQKKDNLVMLEVMSDEEIDLVVGNLSKVPNTRCEVIEDKFGQKRVVVRYFNKKGPSIDMSSALRKAGELYDSGLYEAAAYAYEELLPRMAKPKSFIYSRLGYAYKKQDNYEKAIDYLTMATVQSASEPQVLDYTAMISGLRDKSGYNGVCVRLDDSKSNETSVQYSKRKNSIEGSKATN